MFSWQVSDQIYFNCFLTYPNCEVVDDWDPHIRVSFEAEGEDWGADEENGHNPNCLSKYLLIIDWLIDWLRWRWRGWIVSQQPEWGEQILIEDWQTDKQNTWESDLYFLTMTKTVA